jgi:hypothetical protein
MCQRTRFNAIFFLRFIENCNGIAASIADGAPRKIRKYAAKLEVERC